MQGGSKPARNYLGKQKTVSNVPIRWKSGPDAPETELAYITKAEKDLLIKKDLHGSLKNGPNTGPDDIMSLDSQGDYTRDRSPGAYTGGASSQGGGSPAQQSKGVGTSQQALRDRAMNEAHMKAILTGRKDIGQTTQTGKLTRRYSDLPEWMNVKQKDGTYKRQHMASAYKDTGQRGFLSNLFSRGARGYRGIKGLPAWGNPMKNYVFQEEGPEGPGYYTDMENFGEVRPAFPSFGILGILNALGKRFKKPPVDMSQFNELSLTKPEDQKAYIPAGSDVPMARIDRWTSPIERTFPNPIGPMSVNTPANIFNYRDRIRSMTDFAPSNFNVNQNYGTEFNAPHLPYPMSINQNTIDENEAYNYFNNTDNTSAVIPHQKRVPPGNMRRFKEGGRIGYRYGGDEDEDDLTTLEFMKDQDIPYGEMVSNDINDNILDNLYNKYIDQGFSPTDAEKMALEEFELMSQGQSQGIASLV